LISNPQSLTLTFFLREVRKSSHAPQPQGSPDLTKAPRGQGNSRDLTEGGEVARSSPYCGAWRIRC